MLQNAITDKNEVFTVITTEECTHSMVSRFVKTLEGFSWCKSAPVFYPFL